LRLQVKAEQKKAFRGRFLFGLGGFALGAVSMGIYNFARQ
jgi:hypothetical protein